MKRFWLFLSVAVAGIAVAAAEPSATEFLQTLRRNVSGNDRPRTYAKLDGTLEHLRNDADAETHTLYFGVKISPEAGMSQVIVDGKEGYYIGQNTTADGGKSHTAITPMSGTDPKNSILGRAGVSPGDLSLDFVHFDFVRELPSETLGITPCRVFLLKNPANDQFVRVYAASKYFFVLRADFLSSDQPSATVVRSVEVAAFRKSGDLYYVKKLSFSGPGWRTRIQFDDADVGTFTEADAPKVFRKLDAERK